MRVLGNRRAQPLKAWLKPAGRPPLARSAWSPHPRFPHDHADRATLGRRHREVASTQKAGVSGTSRSTTTNQIPPTTQCRAGARRSWALRTRQVASAQKAGVSGTPRDTTTHQIPTTTTDTSPDQLAMNHDSDGSGRAKRGRWSERAAGRGVRGLGRPTTRASQSSRPTAAPKARVGFGPSATASAAFDGDDGRRRTRPAEPAAMVGRFALPNTTGTWR